MKVTKNMKYEKSVEAREEAWEVASRIRQSDIWVLEDCTRLCALAGLSEQWQEAGAEEFESLVQRAADILGVDIF